MFAVVYLHPIWANLMTYALTQLFERAYKNNFYFDKFFSAYFKIACKNYLRLT